jgi:excisionase family DNA binding protein
MSQVWAAQRLNFSRQEAAILLGISTRALDYAEVNGRIKYTRLGRRCLIHRDELLRFGTHDQPGFNLAA